MLDRTEGVFGHSTDVAAFIDRIEISERETAAATMRPGQAISLEPSFPIARSGGVYARAVNGVCTVTNNPFQRRWGRMLKLPRVPHAQLALRSCGTPVTGAQVDLVSTTLLGREVRSSVCSAELTFDLTGTTIAFFTRHLYTTARTFNLITDARGGKTLYIGCRRSPWQLRIYDKTQDVVRFEFVFRRAFLRRYGIERPCQLLLLRTIDLRRMVKLLRLDRQRIRDIENDSNDYRRRVLCTLARWSTTKQFSALLKERGTGRPDFFTPCALEEKLRLMQQRLIW
jgi:hypothetical protein